MYVYIYTQIYIQIKYMYILHMYMYTNTHSTEVASGSAVEKMGVVVEGAVTLWKQPVEHCSVLQCVAICCNVLQSVRT